MTLADNIHRLLAEHMTISETGEFVKAPPLLAQLRAASGSSLGAQGGGSGGAGMVVSAKAVKVENEIREAALYEHFEMAGTEYRGSLVAMLKTWPLINLDEWQDYLEHVTMDWIDDITSVLESKRPPYRPSIPCPACSQRFHGPEREPCLAVYFWDDDADTIAPPASWIAKCDGCGAEWNGDNLKWLRAASDTPEREYGNVGLNKVVFILARG